MTKSGPTQPMTSKPGTAEELQSGLPQEYSDVLNMTLQGGGKRLAASKVLNVRTFRSEAGGEKVYKCLTARERVKVRMKVSIQDYDVGDLILREVQCRHSPNRKY